MTTTEKVEMQDETDLYMGGIVQAEHVHVDGVWKSIRLHYGVGEEGHMIEISVDEETMGLKYSSAR